MAETKMLYNFVMEGSTHKDLSGIEFKECIGRIET